MVFREIAYGSADFREACALRHKVLRAPLGRSLYDEDLSVESGQMHFGLFVGERLVACVIAMPVSPTEAKIRQMAVAPQSRGGGCGRLLLEQLERVLAGQGILHVWMHARADAVGFYEKLGYERTSCEFIEVGIAHLKMEKYLPRHPSRDFPDK